MRVYTVHCRPGSREPDADASLVKEGFSWPAFLIPPLWLLYHRLWAALFAVVIVGLVLDIGLDFAGAGPITVFIAGAGFSVFVGFGANDWRRRKMTRLGLPMVGIVAAGDHDAAMRRYFDLHPYEPRAFHRDSSAAIGGL